MWSEMGGGRAVETEPRRSLGGGLTEVADVTYRNVGPITSR